MIGSLFDVKLEVMTLSAIIHGRFVLHVTQRTIAIMGRLVRIRARQILRFLGKRNVVVTLQAGRIFRPFRIVLIGTMAHLTTDAL